MVCKNNQNYKKGELYCIESGALLFINKVLNVQGNYGSGSVAIFNGNKNKELSFFADQIELHAGNLVKNMHKHLSVALSVYIIFLEAKT